MPGVITDVNYDTLSFPDNSSDSSSSGDVSGGGDGGDSLLTQLSGLFSSIGTTVSSTVRGVSGPQTVRPGTIVLDSTGRPVTTGLPLGFPQSNQGLILLALGIVIVLLVVFSRR